MKSKKSSCLKVKKLQLGANAGVNAGLNNGFDMSKSMPYLSVANGLLGAANKKKQLKNQQDMNMMPNSLADEQMNNNKIGDAGIGALETGLNAVVPYSGTIMKASSALGDAISPMDNKYGIDYYEKYGLKDHVGNVLSTKKFGDIFNKDAGETNQDVALNAITMGGYDMFNQLRGKDGQNQYAKDKIKQLDTIDKQNQDIKRRGIGSGDNYNIMKNKYVSNNLLAKHGVATNWGVLKMSQINNVPKHSDNKVLVLKNNQMMDAVTKGSGGALIPFANNENVLVENKEYLLHDKDNKVVGVLPEKLGKKVLNGKITLHKAINSVPNVDDAEKAPVKMQEGGIFNNEGYLIDSPHKDNKYNIIEGGHITTKNMAFPIYANGKKLYPNTGDYHFKDKNGKTSSFVIERKAQIGLKNPKTLGNRNFKNNPTKTSGYNNGINFNKQYVNPNYNEEYSNMQLPMTKNISELSLPSNTPDYYTNPNTSIKPMNFGNLEDRPIDLVDENNTSNNMLGLNRVKNNMQLDLPNKKYQINNSNPTGTYPQMFNRPAGIYDNNLTKNYPNLVNGKTKPTIDWSDPDINNGNLSASADTNESLYNNNTNQFNKGVVDPNALTTYGYHLYNFWQALNAKPNKEELFNRDPNIQKNLNLTDYKRQFGDINLLNQQSMANLRNKNSAIANLKNNTLSASSRIAGLSQINNQNNEATNQMYQNQAQIKRQNYGNWLNAAQWNNEELGDIRQQHFMERNRILGELSANQQAKDQSLQNMTQALQDRYTSANKQKQAELNQQNNLNMQKLQYTLAFGTPEQKELAMKNIQQYSMGGDNTAWKRNGIRTRQLTF